MMVRALLPPQTKVLSPAQLQTMMRMGMSFKSEPKYAMAENQIERRTAWASSTKEARAKHR
jgi:hypothetical protein